MPVARQFCHTKSDDWKCIWLTHKLGRQSAGKGSPVARLRLLARRWVLLVESSVTQCPMSTGDDVFCAPKESVAMSCGGVGGPIGKPV